MVARTGVVLSVIGVLIVGVSMLAMPSPAQDAKAAVTFDKDVLPILQKNCQTCHRPGQIGPFSMLSYKDARPWAKAIKTAVMSRTMPPWFADPHYGHFTNDRSLKQAEIDTIAAWVDGGAPEGDAKDAPAAVEWSPAGWQIKPDVVVDLPPFQVPARGVLDWTNIAVPLPFKEDTWVTSIEVLPGEPSVVHHFCFDFEKHKPTTMYNTYEWVVIPRDEDGVAVKAPRPPSGEVTEGNSAFSPEGIVVTREAGSTVEKRRTGKPVLSNTGTFCYLPGLPFEDYRPLNAAYFIPAGSDITLNLHYTTNGLAVTDKTKIGFTVSKVPPVKQFLPSSQDTSKILSITPGPKSGEFAIPPYEANYVAPASVSIFNKDVEIVSLRPHAHVRAKSVKYVVTYPDGREETVLNVPHYDFNWQLTYAMSLKIPKGSKMTTQFVYDNSPNNRYNPDPSKWVYNGQQSWEEMGTPFPGFLVDRMQ